MSSRVLAFVKMNGEERDSFLASLSPEEATQLLYDWSFWRRPNQAMPQGEWINWLLMSGRGFGKTRTGAEGVREWVEDALVNPPPEGKLRIALVAETAADARDVMIEGESGLLAVSPPWLKPEYEPSKRRISWTYQGKVIAEGTTFSGKEPDQLRGPQFHKAWVDEWAKFQYPEETMDNLEFGLRLGINPQKIITTTPRPLHCLKQMIKAPGTVMTTGSSYENIANLAPAYVQTVIRKYEGTRQGLQEIHARILDDVPGALWTEETLERNRVKRDIVKKWMMVVISVDPSVTSKNESNECGISVCALDEIGHGYLLAELSGVMTPGQWAQQVSKAYRAWEADLVVGEANNGGDLVEHTIKSVDPSILFKKVFASKGKAVRAQPIAALYEQGKIHHVGHFPDLEDQLKNFDNERYNGPGSPDRAESAIWGFSYLMLRRMSKSKGKYRTVKR